LFTKYPNLRTFVRNFPNLGKVPKTWTDVILKRLDVDVDGLPNWKDFASAMWPNKDEISIMVDFPNKTHSVLILLSTHLEDTVKVLQAIEKIERYDVLKELDKYRG